MLIIYYYYDSSEDFRFKHKIFAYEHNDTIQEKLSLHEHGMYNPLVW